MTDTTAASLSLNTLYLPGMMANPYPFYHRLREAGTVLWDPEWRNWIVTGHHAVLQAARHPRMSAARVGEYVDWLPEEFRALARDDARRQRRLLLFMDAPEHTALRSVMARAFTPRLVEQLRGWIETMVAEILERARAQGSMDVMADLAYPLPAAVIAELLGVPAADREQFVAWSVDYEARWDGGNQTPEQHVQALAGVRALNAYMADLAQERSKKPQDDLISSLVTVNAERKLLSIQELADNLGLLLFAGHETTTNLIGNGTLALLRNPSELSRLRADPTLTESAVEELLRYDSPVQLTGRLALEGIEIDGVHIEAGQFVQICVGAANRDPQQFVDPDRLDLGRPDNRHLAFLQGPHYCLGAALARLEGQVTLGALAREPRLDLLSADPPWRENVIFHGLAALPVTLS